MIVSGDVRIESIELTNAQLIILAATPVEMIPAPGAGLVAVPLHMIVRFTRGTVAYSVNSNLRLEFVGSTTNLTQTLSIPFADGGGASRDQCLHVNRTLGLTFADDFNPSNRAIEVLLDADINNGNASDLLRVSVLYEIVPSAALGY
ncbi:MAG: hypothetical protein ACRD3G_11380 [Vicinamibacterales bacterium]